MKSSISEFHRAIAVGISTFGAAWPRELNCSGLSTIRELG